MVVVGADLGAVAALEAMVGLGAMDPGTGLQKVSKNTDSLALLSSALRYTAISYEQLSFKLHTRFQGQATWN